MGALSDWKTTVPGLLLLVVMVGGATYAMVKGLCTFDTWWQNMLMIFGSAGGGVLLAANTKKQ